MPQVTATPTIVNVLVLRNQNHDKHLHGAKTGACDQSGIAEMTGVYHGYNLDQIECKQCDEDPRRLGYRNSKNLLLCFRIFLLYLR